MKRFFPPFHKRLLRMSSIRMRIRNSYLIIIVLMLIPAAVSLFFISVQTRRYDQLITNVSNAGELNKIVRDSIPDEGFEIVAGKKEFSQGSQYRMIAGVYRRLDELAAHAPNNDNYKLLVVAGRAMNRLESYMDKLGSQISEGLPVEEQELTLEEIRGVASLITDVLQEYILLEIEVAAQANEGFTSAARFTMTVEIVIIAVVCLFASITQMAVSRSISQPIVELERLAERIADGELDARAESTDVAELKSLNTSLNTMAGKLQELIDANRLKQESLTKSEMRILQAQITPHFLYNTLDAIMWLAQSGRSEEVVHMTKAMSRFFRIVLSQGRDWISVSQEIEHVQSYLAVQHVRYRDILDYSFEIDPRLDGQLILKLVLQPLVENAIYHGIKLRRGKGNIRVRGRLSDDGMMHFCVEDDGIGMKPERLTEVRGRLSPEEPEVEDRGYGLYNVDKRLRLYYGESAGLCIESEFEKGTAVSFRIPVKEDRSVV